MINCAEYGKALFLLALEENKDEQIFEEVKSLSKIFKENNDYVIILDSPAVMLEEKLSLIDSSLKDCDEYVKNFVKILCEKHSVFQFEDCVKAYSKEYDKHHNIIRSVVISAVKLSDTQLEKMKLALEKKSGKTVFLENEIDPSLIGGVVLRTEGKQFDGSIKGRLDSMKRSIEDIKV